MVLLKDRVELNCSIVEESSLNLSAFFVDDVDVHETPLAFLVFVVSLFSFLSDSRSNLPVRTKLIEHPNWSVNIDVGTKPLLIEV
jgi:hypothetical protein